MSWLLRFKDFISGLTPEQTQFIIGLLKVLFGITGQAPVSFQASPEQNDTVDALTAKGVQVEDAQSATAFISNAG